MDTRIQYTYSHFILYTVIFTALVVGTLLLKEINQSINHATPLQNETTLSEEEWEKQVDEMSSRVVSGVINDTDAYEVMKLRVTSY